MPATLQPSELDAMQWSAPIVTRPTRSARPASTGNLAHLYAAHFKRQCQIDKPQSVIRKEQP